MLYNEYMAKCGKSLQELPEYPSDSMLMYLIQLCKLDEDVRELYRMEKSEIHTEASQLRLQLHAKSFKSRLEDWKASISPSMQQTCKSFVMFPVYKYYS